MYDKARAADHVTRPEAADSHQGQERDCSSDRPDRFAHPAPPIPTGLSCGGRRPSIVVDAAGAGSPEKGERPIVRVEHHLLRLSRICTHEQHPAVAESDMCHLYRHGCAAQHDDLVAPVELISALLAFSSSASIPAYVTRFPKPVVVLSTIVVSLLLPNAHSEAWDSTLVSRIDLAISTRGQNSEDPP
jgi:hypothetical protein